ncbi:MAG: DNA polymerase III subunit delta' [Candidatus Eisenbacteria bacterium]|nr:DNA polymerase III subunit delta' [Candidatus Eisenbacteria bacterium]
MVSYRRTRTSRCSPRAVQDEELERMSLSRIRGQDQAVRLLSAATASDRMPHAYLFHGPDGVGKETTALEFARALYCDGADLEPCGECASCAQIAGLGHPDVHLIFPTPTSFKPAARAEILADYVENGYRSDDYGRKTAVISVDSVLSDVVGAASRRPYVGPWKVFVIADADRMTTEGANTLLKTLEEPPEGTVIILTSSRPTALPDTVVSRCQRVPFTRLSRGTIEGILVSDDRLGFTEKEARAAAAIALGSAGAAVRAEKSGLEGELDHVAGLVMGKGLTGVRPLLSEAQRLAFRLGRQDQERLLELMALWYRDVLVEKAAGGEVDLLYASHADAVRSEAAAYDYEQLDRLITGLDEARRAIERYSNPSIVFTSVLLDVAVARKRAGLTRGRRHAA